MEVGYVVSTFETGGAETMLLRHVEYADDDPVVFRLGGSADLEPEFRAAGATVQNLDVETIASVGELRRARAAFAAHDFDVLHAHLPAAMVVARLAGRAAGVPAVVSTHHRASEYARPFRVAERVTRPLDSHEIAVSDGVRANHASRFDLAEWSTIYNGIDVSAFNSRVRDATPPDRFDGSGPTFLNVGRYVPVKGQRYLVAAMESVVAERPGAQAVVVGHGHLRDELEALVADRGLADSVHVTGKVPGGEIHRYYALADAFVLPSLSEGFPVTVLEAMAAELPVVGTTVQGVAEAVTGDVGELVPPRDPERLADAMLTVAGDDRAAVGERAFQRARSRFDIRRTVAAHRRLYRRLAERAG